MKMEREDGDMVQGRGQRKAQKKVKKRQLPVQQVGDQDRSQEEDGERRKAGARNRQECSRW